MKFQRNWKLIKVCPFFFLYKNDFCILQIYISVIILAELIKDVEAEIITNLDIGLSEIKSIINLLVPNNKNNKFSEKRSEIFLITANSIDRF